MIRVIANDELELRVEKVKIANGEQLRQRQSLLGAFKDSSPSGMRLFLSWNVGRIKRTMTLIGKSFEAKILSPYLLLNVIKVTRESFWIMAKFISEGLARR